MMQTKKKATEKHMQPKNAANSIQLIETSMNVAFKKAESHEAYSEATNSVLNMTLENTE